MLEHVLVVAQVDKQEHKNASKVVDEMELEYWRTMALESVADPYLMPPLAEELKSDFTGVFTQAKDT